MQTDVVSTAPAESHIDANRMEVPDRLVKLPSINPTASKLLSLSDDLGLKRFVALIEEDPAFSAEVLGMANSALFGSTSDVHDVSRAIALIGLERLRALALTAAGKLFVGTEASPMLRDSWAHSLACALLCRELAPFFRLDDGRGYTLGLMHDIGRLGLIKSYPDEYSAVLSQQCSGPEEIIRLEQTVLKIDHCKAGFWLTRTWGFPAAFSKICTQHHEPIDARGDDYLRLVQVSCALATSLGFSATRYNAAASCEEILSNVPAIDVNDEKWSADQVRERIASKVMAAER